VSNSTPSQALLVTPGSILAGKYRVERIIGQGGMGMVVEAHHIVLDERVALKFLLTDYALNPDASARFLREGKAAAKIKSEHVARIHDASTLDTGVPYMMMEFLEGRDLAKTLDLVGALPVSDAIDYILQACEAIAEAHSLGIIHRDLKPANLFLSKRPDGSPIVKVLDFGISKISGSGVENLTKTMASLGSALYMSPEQMQQTRSVDHRTDIYALGITLYELLAGKQPYYAETLPQLCAEILTGTPTPLRTMRPEISEELAQVVEKAFARERAERYQSVAELVIALAPFAPTRSQIAIERVARMAGLAAPAAGNAGEQPSNTPARASTPDALGATELFPALEALPPTRDAAAFALDPALPKTAPLPSLEALADAAPLPPVPAQPPSRPGTDPNQIVLGPYSAPMSARAAASFAQGEPVDAALLTRVKRPRHGGPPGALVLSIVAIVALGGVAAAYVLRSAPPRSDTHPAPALDTPETPMADKSPEATAEPSVTVEHVPPPEPPKPAESAPVAPSASAAPTAVPAPSSPLRKGTRKPSGSSSTPAGKPSAAPKTTDIYNTSH
jgi:tRNA A-37 threonylcarbamoyl transferase component Bud32